MRALPYLNGIKAFEAAARCGSFAGAGSELHVTPAALSRMVRLLEDRLGVTLFERGTNRLTLTIQVRAYQNGLAVIFDSLTQLTAQIQASAAHRVLTIGVGPPFAIRWLIPRLGAFRAVAPDIEVQITTGGAAAPFADDWTCGIKLGDGRTTRSSAHRRSFRRYMIHESISDHTRAPPVARPLEAQRPPPHPGALLEQLIRNRSDDCCRG